jgi:hypothetical protein
MEDARNVSLRMRGGGCGGSKSSLSLKQVPMKALRADELTEVDLSGKGLGPEEALALGDVMKIGSKLVACNLLKNDFDVESATMLASIGEEKRIMLSGAIKHDVHEQPEVVLCRQGLRAADGILIASDLRMSNVLTSLDLCRNELCSVRDADGRDTYTAEGIKAVADALRVNASLTSLDLGYNKIGKEAVLNLVSIFKEKDQMQSVGLANVDLGNDGAKAVAKAVAEYVSVSASLTSL